MVIGIPTSLPVFDQTAHTLKIPFKNAYVLHFFHFFLVGMPETEIISVPVLNFFTPFFNVLK